MRGTAKEEGRAGREERKKEKIEGALRFFYQNNLPSSAHVLNETKPWLESMTGCCDSSLPYNPTQRKF